MDRLGGNLLHEAERLLREGRRQDAYPLLTDYIRAHPNSARGWWMLSLAVTDLKQQIDCMERVLQIDRNYAPARDRLASLRERLAFESPDAPIVRGLSPSPETHRPAPIPAPVIHKIDAASQPLRPTGRKSNQIPQLALLSVMACTAIGIFGFIGIRMLQGRTLASISPQQTQAAPLSAPEMPTQFLLPPTWTPTSTITATTTLTPTSTNTPVPATPTLIYTLTKTPVPKSSIGPATGMYAPDFSLKNINTDNQVSLSDYQGKAVVIYFWATWCPYCEAEVPSLQQIYEAYKDQGLVVLGIDVGESAGKARKYRDAHGLSFPILNDAGQSVSGKYRVTGFPTHFFVDANGKILYIAVGMMDYSGLNMKVRAILNSVP